MNAVLFHTLTSSLNSRRFVLTFDLMMIYFYFIRKKGNHIISAFLGWIALWTPWWTEFSFDLFEENQVKRIDWLFLCLWWTSQIGGYVKISFRISNSGAVWILWIVVTIYIFVKVSSKFYPSSTLFLYPSLHFISSSKKKKIFALETHLSLFRYFLRLLTNLVSLLISPDRLRVYTE